MHQPVMLHETIDNLITDPHGIYVDCTVGGGGHLRYLLGKVADDARVIGLDKDIDILERGRKTLSFPNLNLVQSDFRTLSGVLKEQEIEAVDGIMMDLGVSSFQLDEAERGFSFHEDAVLDMRMNRKQSLTARDIVNYYDESEISKILFNYGEEKFSRSISRAIVKYRSSSSIDSTLQLVDIIRSAVPAKYCRDKHPARKTFQALRIAVNAELDALLEVLPQAVEALKKDGRLCIITFHSLEDRIVKKFMQEEARECICPPGLPICICNHSARLKIISRKPVLPTTEECEINPRARSAKLRIASKI